MDTSQRIKLVNILPVSNPGKCQMMGMWKKGGQSHKSDSMSPEVVSFSCSTQKEKGYSANVYKQS
jgi:hypothetical protein